MEIKNDNVELFEEMSIVEVEDRLALIAADRCSEEAAPVE
jgi:hypothetical protein